MKARTSCIVDDHNCSSEFEDDLMECGDLFDLAALTEGLEEGEVDIYDMAERLTTILGRGQPLIPMATSEDEDDDASSDEADTSSIASLDGRDADSTDPSQWTEALLADLHDRNLLLAGYADCMDEAIRYLVEEEKYSLEHPVVEGLRQHLVAQQERVILEASRANHLDNSNNNQAAVHRGVAHSADTFCNIRPPSI